VSTDRALSLVPAPGAESDDLVAELAEFMDLDQIELGVLASLHQLSHNKEKLERQLAAIDRLRRTIEARRADAAVAAGAVP
jgi:hypothetical protein